MKTLLIDDTLEIDATVVARTYDAAILALKYLGPFDLLYLGDLDEKKTGNTIVCFLESNTEYLPKSIELVVYSPVNRQNMKTVIDHLYPNED